MPDSAAIETFELTKRFGSVLAVDHLSFTVERGEVFGFLGPNGSGKSTTMRMLLGLARPTSGRASVLGLDARSQLPEILKHTGAMIETPTFYPFLSGRENLRLVGDLTGTSRAQVDVALHDVDMLDHADRPFKNYSMGMKQRIGIASTLLSDPELLILDEPANGLDPAGIVDVRALMQRLRSQGRTIFVSSHVLHEVEQVCDRIAILNHGRVVAQGAVQELLSGSDRIEVQVEPAPQAVEVIKQIPWVTAVDQQEKSLILTAPVDRSAEITKALADKGLYPSIIHPHQESLERYFLELTGEPAP